MLICAHERCWHLARCRVRLYGLVVYVCRTHKSELQPAATQVSCGSLSAPTD